MNRKKLKALVLACSVLVSLGAVSSVSYAGTIKAPADADSPLGYYSVGDLVKTSDFDDGIGAPWESRVTYPSSADFNVENGKYNIKISNTSGEDRFAISVKQGGMTLEAGHTYTITFDITSDADCMVYAKVGDEGAPYGEYWNNNWTPVSVPKGETKYVTDKFTMNAAKDNCCLDFQLSGDCAAKTLPYTVSLDNVHIYDEQFKGYPIEPSESTNPVRVNQLGYYLNEEKTAVLNSPSAAPVSWRLLDSNDKVVKSGMTTVKGEDKSSGENVHLIDFSDYHSAGSGYKIEVDDSAIDSDSYDSTESMPFSIVDKGLYDVLKYDSLKYFYHNRSAMDITMPYCDNEDFARSARYPKDVLPVDKDTWYGAEGYNYSLDVTGGWLGSVKNERYVSEGSYATWMLQNKYENALGKDAFSTKDNVLNIPESGDGYPDILNEARFNLLSLLKMQVPDGQEYSGMVHNNAAPLGWYVPNDDDENPTYPRKLTPPSTSATLDFAAVAAQSARLWDKYDAVFSEECLAAAQKAWNAAMAHPDILVSAQGNDDFVNNNIDDEFYWAACELYASTGEQQYLDYMKSSKYYLTMPLTINKYESEIYGSFDAVNVQGLGTLSLISADSKLDSSELDKAKTNILDAADKILAIQNKEGYGVPLEESYLKDIDSYGYPSNSNLYSTNAAIVLSYAHDLTKENNQDKSDKYLTGALSTLDYLLGKNAENKSFITGYGSNKIKHPFYNINKNKDVPSGWLVNGPDSVLEDKVLSRGAAPQKCYIDDSESWSTNRVSLNDNASLAWLSNYLSENIPDTIHITGDVNGDGRVSIQDYIMLQRYLMDNSISIKVTNADMNGDEKINVVDLLLIKKALMS